MEVNYKTFNEDQANSKSNFSSNLQSNFQVLDDFIQRDTNFGTFSSKKHDNLASNELKKQSGQDIHETNQFENTINSFKVKQSTQNTIENKN